MDENFEKLGSGQREILTHPQDRNKDTFGNTKNEASFLHSFYQKIIRNFQRLDFLFQDILEI